MSISLYYHASRATPLTNAEKAALERIVANRDSSFPYDDEEGLFLYGIGGSEPDDIVTGSTKMPYDLVRVPRVIAHLLDSVTELRRALPAAEWSVHLDDLDIPWAEDTGYALPASNSDPLDQLDTL